MKTIFCLLTSVLISAVAFGQGDSTGSVAIAAPPIAGDKTAAGPWGEANTAYVNADYDRAVSLYESILSQQEESAMLYYNLGNAYFKNGSIAKAILNYSRAQRLAPSDADIEYNMAIANAYVVDKIDAVPVFFLTRWIRQWQGSLSSNVWAVLSIVYFVLLLTCLALYLLMGNMAVRKAGFYGSILFVFMFAATVVFAAKGKNRITKPVEAVIMNSAVSVKSSPDSGSKDIFILHSGTKVKVVGELNGWREIMISNGNKGWLQISAIEMI